MSPQVTLDTNDLRECIEKALTPATLAISNLYAEKCALRSVLEETLGWMERSNVGSAHAQAIREVLSYV